MKAVTIGPEFGKENLRLVDVSKPNAGYDDVIVRITKAGLNPIDYNLVHGKIVYSLTPIPHIPGSEAIGIVESSSRRFKRGDRVVIYNRSFDGTCNMCRSHNEHLCVNGGIWGVVTNGAYTEYVSVPERNLFRIPDSIEDDLAVSLPIGALTAYRSLIRSNAKAGEKILIYGASGNTGIFAAQFANLMGLEVYGVSRKSWLREYGCRETYRMGEIPNDFKADIVLNSLGTNFWTDAYSHVENKGRLVTFGVLTGREAPLDIARLYTSEISVIGSTGGTTKDLENMMKLVSQNSFRAPVSARFRLDEMKQAMTEFESERDGRIIIDVS